MIRTHSSLPASRISSEGSRPSDTEVRHLTAAVAALLRELHEAVSLLTASQYTQKPVGPVQSSVGGHVRHCLDHVEAVLAREVLGDLDYDVRQRGTSIETDVRTALTHMETLIEKLLRVEELPGDLFSLRAAVSADGRQVEVFTTAERELLFVFSHTLHHHAIVRVLVTLLGVQVPERFGYAPATVAFMQGATCAR